LSLWITLQLAAHNLWITLQLAAHNLWIILQLAAHNLWITLQLAAHNLWITLQLAAHKQTICSRHHPTITFTVLVLCPYQKIPDIINFTKPFTDLIEYQYHLCIAVGQRKMCNLFNSS
jgi:hypothetical protein